MTDDINSLSLKDDDDSDDLFIEEDARAKVIGELTDPEEIKAAQEIYEEKYGVPGSETTPGEAEPKGATIEEKPKDTSVKPADKTEEEKSKETAEAQAKADAKAKEETAKIVGQEGQFTVTDEEIQKQPEENREILTKYKGKTKAELANAAANAVALKNPYLKDDKEMIEKLAKKFEGFSNEDVVKTLIESQREVGKTAGDEPQKEVKAELPKVELPVLPEEDPKIQAILNTEVVKRLKKLYPDMPEDMTSVEYKDWERDFLDEKGLRDSTKLIADIEKVEQSVKNQLQKAIYAQTNLNMLYVDSPDEILPLMKDEDLPRLKHLNDNYKEINNKAITNEVEAIKAELKSRGISEKDLGLDFAFIPDRNGIFYNPVISPLMVEGQNEDGTLKINPNIVGMFGKVPYLKKGQLKEKFLNKYQMDITNLLLDKKLKTNQIEAERLKTEALNTGGGTSGIRKEAGNEMDIKKETNPQKIRETQEAILAKYN